MAGMFACNFWMNWGMERGEMKVGVLLFESLKNSFALLLAGQAAIRHFVPTVVL